jgi:hypothetical protein
MSTKSREHIFGHSIRYSAEKAKLARLEADKLACVAWNQRMLGFKGPAKPSPALGDALNAGYLYLEVRCLGCDTHQTVALDIVRRPKTTPVHELERYMRCKDCSEVRGYPYKRSHLVALRLNKISAHDPPSTLAAGGTIAGLVRDWRHLHLATIRHWPTDSWNWCLKEKSARRAGRLARG